MFRFLIAVSVLTFSFVAFPAALTVVSSKANAASVEELITSLEGYSCADTETSEAVTFLFHEVNGTTTLLTIGDSIFDSANVEETRNGYRITPIGGFSGFLSEIDNHWKLFVATPEGTFTIDCQDLGTLPQLITQALYELLDENVAQDHRTAVQKIREAELRVDAANQELREANLVISRLRAQLLELSSVDDSRRVTPLNEQVEVLRAQLRQLQGLLDEAEQRDSDAQVQIQALGSQLNTALAQVAAEQRARAEVEAERARLLEGENKNLENFRSEFFGRLREILGDAEGVRVVGDRFVFSSSVLFPPGGVDLAPAGQDQLARIADTIRTIDDRIPTGIDWILRVDGHTDDVPVSGGGRYADNWELSQARALSVVQFMITLGIPPNRLAATGFGEFRPIAEGTSNAARAQNRRIELKLTQR